MSKLITWCRLMRVGPACPTPCDECRLTSRKYALAGIDVDTQLSAAHDEPNSRHQPLTDEPCGVIPTQAGLDYLALRRQQHPKAATDA